MTTIEHTVDEQTGGGDRAATVAARRGPGAAERLAARRPASCASATAGSRCASAVRTAGGSSASGATRPTRPPQGYTCEKALRLDHYQNGRHRLTSPLRRRPDGTFEEIDWDTAIAEVAARLRAGARRARRRVDLLLRRRRPGEPPRRRLQRRPPCGPSAPATARTPSPRRRPASSGSTPRCSAPWSGATSSTRRSRSSSARTRGSPTASRTPGRRSRRSPAIPSGR